MGRSTHTHATLKISTQAYKEIKDKLISAGYQHAFIDSGDPENPEPLIDMHGIALHDEQVSTSDGYHTFDELYEHRIELFLALCRWIKLFSRFIVVWCSRQHHDGTMFEGWFVLGIDVGRGRDITYHLPMKYWDRVEKWALVLDKAREWDGHTSADVIERLKKL